MLFYRLTPKSLEEMEAEAVAEEAAVIEAVAAVAAQKAADAADEAEAAVAAVAAEEVVEADEAAEAAQVAAAAETLEAAEVEEAAATAEAGAGKVALGLEESGSTSDEDDHKNNSVTEQQSNFRELVLAPIHPKAPATDTRRPIHLKLAGDALLLGRASEAPRGQQFESGIQSTLVHRKHVLIQGTPPVITVLGLQPCVVINSAGRLKLTRGQSYVLSELDEIHLIDVGLAQVFSLTQFGTDYTGDACAYRVDRAAPLLLQPIAPDGRTHRRGLQLGTTAQLRLGRTGGPWGLTDPRVSRLHARIRAGPGPPTVTAEGAHPCILVKALTGAQRLH